MVRRLEKPLELAAIKADKLLAKWDLVRLPRLSVVPVSDEQWRRIERIMDNG
jgi:predicted RNA-binding protein with PUA-like domain